MMANVRSSQMAYARAAYASQHVHIAKPSTQPSPSQFKEYQDVFKASSEAWTELQQGSMGSKDVLKRICGGSKSCYRLLRGELGADRQAAGGRACASGWAAGHMMRGAITPQRQSALQTTHASTHSPHPRTHSHFQLPTLRPPSPASHSRRGHTLSHSRCRSRSRHCQSCSRSHTHSHTHNLPSLLQHTWRAAMAAPRSVTWPRCV